MEILLIGIGAAGNKAAMKAVEEGIVKEKDCIIINSTSKDFPDNFEGEKIILSPNDTGCGKERSIAKEYALSAIKAGKLNFNVQKYSTIVICTSVEGGTGSGATPLIAQFVNEVHKKNTHVIAFTGFEEDVRGLANTIEFFQEIKSSLIVQTISNKGFMKLAGNNKFKAEDMANKEMVERIKILTGVDFISSKQNIDDTDILKLSNTAGYITVEKVFLDKPLVDQEAFNKVIKKMIYESKSIQVKNPGAARLGVILNVDPASEDAIDFTFADLKAAYGNPYECFLQNQWDGKREYIAFIASGMQMPLEELEEIYARYKEASDKVNKSTDEFFKSVAGMKLQEDDKRFDMIRPVEKGESINDFLAKFETK